jgi:hypothetical protein
MSRVRGVALGCALAPALCAGDVRGNEIAAPPSGLKAAPSSATTSRVSLAATPVFGADAATGDGWFEAVARVTNTGALPARGTIQLSSQYGPFAFFASETYIARAPFHVQPGAEVVIHLPMRSGARSAAPATVTAADDAGTKLAEASLSLGPSAEPLLVDVDQPSRLSLVMRGWPMAPSWHPAFAPYVAAGSPTALSVGSPSIDAATGDPVLPESAAGYSAATVVVIASHRLARLDGRPLDALIGWTLAGGTLAVFPTRPEDLRSGVLPMLVGGVLTTTPPPPGMSSLPSVSRPGGFPSLVTPPKPAPSPAWPAPASPEGGGATPIGWVVPARTTPLGATSVGPSPALRAKLTGFSGGYVRPSEYGATAPYGLGQVHVLAFDPTGSAAIEDGWAHARLLDMLDEAWERRALFVFPHGSGAAPSMNLDDVRRSLDPNENFRPALGVAAILLVLYSIVAGPIAFARARRRARPLEPLLWAPVASAACFTLVVLVGLAGKGWSGRARRVSLVEAGAGMPRGSVRRFRGLYSSQTRAMRIRASEPAAVLEAIPTESRGQPPAALRLDKDGTSLEDINSLPWQTVVVVEDGFADLRGGIAVREKPDGSVLVTNRTGRKLKDVIVWAPKRDASWFSAVADGESVLSTSGRTIFAAGARAAVAAGSRTVHQIEASPFETVLPGRTGEDMALAWGALGRAAGASVDWWPDEVPIVLAEVAGGEQRTEDTGLRVESDRLFVRVVGEGGAT